MYNPPLMKSQAEILTEMLAGMTCSGSYTFEGRFIECVEAGKLGMKPRKYPFVEGDTTHVLFPPETDEEYERRRLVHAAR